MIESVSSKLPSSLILRKIEFFLIHVTQIEVDFASRNKGPKIRVKMGFRLSLSLPLTYAKPSACWDPTQSQNPLPLKQAVNS